jgi:hypothetical protein
LWSPQGRASTFGAASACAHTSPAAAACREPWDGSRGGAGGHTIR